MLDGAAKIGAMTQAAAEYGMPAIAVTDHGNTFAAFEFYKAAQAAGVKPIIGLEAYVTPAPTAATSRVWPGAPDQKSDDVSGSGAYTHMTMWSQTTEGMHNLFRLSSLEHGGVLLQAAHGPRAAADLRQGPHRDDRLPLGGGADQAAPRAVRRGAAAAAEFQDIFGKENYFAEIMDHGLSIERAS
jgi:DNA polymerase-3 subunit alpha